MSALLLTYPEDRMAIPTILSCSQDGDQDFNSRVADGDWRQLVLTFDKGPKRSGIGRGRWYSFRDACLEFQRIHHRFAPNDYRRRSA